MCPQSVGEFQSMSIDLWSVYKGCDGVDLLTLNPTWDLTHGLRSWKWCTSCFVVLKFDRETWILECSGVRWAAIFNLNRKGLLKWMLFYIILLSFWSFFIYDQIQFLLSFEEHCRKLHVEKFSFSKIFQNFTISILQKVHCSIWLSCNSETLWENRLLMVSLIDIINIPQ